MPLSICFNIQTIHVNHLYTTALLIFPQNPYTLAGFEPRSAFPEADAMSTVPRRHQGGGSDEF
jgi:hypothetical protein